MVDFIVYPRHVVRFRHIVLKTFYCICQTQSKMLFIKLKDYFHIHHCQSLFHFFVTSICTNALPNILHC